MGKTGIVGQGRDQSAAAGLPFRMGATFSLRELEDGIAWQRLRHPRAFVGTFQHEFRAGHAERIEDVLLFKFIKCLSGYDLDDAPEHVG